MLSLIGTPIGNLEDLSLRAARTLLTADVILAEDTRSVRALIERASQIMENTEHNKDEESRKIVSYYKEVEYQKLPQVMEWLADGLHVALVSEAGMPLISDPGYLLVHEARKRDIPLTVIPGPSAVQSALVASGMAFDHYQFVGFLPKKEGERARLFEQLKIIQDTMGKTKLVFVAFESPERTSSTLKYLYATYPAVEIALCRELTKKFEEIIAQPSPDTHYRGEITLVFRF